MGRYLVVTHKTADSPELLDALSNLAGSDGEAEFELLVPATPVRQLVNNVDEDRHVAVLRANSAAKSLRAAGLKVTGATAGDANVVDAIRDHLGDHSGYHSIVIATLPRGVSRWLRMDVVTRAERLLGKPVIHVVAQPAESQAKTPRVATG